MDAGNKPRTANVLAFRDKAMAHLLKYVLEPVYESTADSKCFWSRRGRSPLDSHAYLMRDLSGPGSPDYVVVADVMKFYDHVMQEWLLANIPIPSVIPPLREILKSGVIKGDSLCPTEQGLSLANPISAILANMALNGLQSYLFDRLFPNGGVDYLDANVNRFCDDLLITTRSMEHGELILQALTEFLSARGLRVNPKKTFVKRAASGFNFLGRMYWKTGTVLTARPSFDYMRRKEQELKELILNFKGTQRELIEQINWKLRRIGKYQQVTDAFMEFRHLDTVVEGLLVIRMCSKHPRWGREAILNRFWIKDGDDHIFALPSDPSVRIMLLAPTPIVQHKPIRLKYNPFLDEDYYAWLKYKRDAQKASGKYRSVWIRQNGKCAFCGKAMLPDQDVEVVEKELGEGRSARNLLYVHHSCLYDAFYSSGDDLVEPLDLFSMLDGIMDETPADESPYLELREFFRLCEKTPLSLTFGQIEEILGDQLAWQAYFYEAFWYETAPDAPSPMWKKEGFPFHMLVPFDGMYCISESWLSQGYKIKALHLSRQYVVFRKDVERQSGLVIPKRLMTRKLPDAAVYEAAKFFEHLMKKYGI